MASGMIHRLISVLTDASGQLGIGCRCQDVEATAFIVHRIMSRQSRQFHTLAHVFGFIEDATDGHSILAAVFHDLVYYQVDDGIPPELEGLVKPYIVRDEQGIRLNPAAAADDRHYRLCLAVFGMQPDSPLAAASGLNEFLSALAFTSLMRNHLSRPDLMAVLVCIEASIPFRGRNAEGRDLGEELEHRLLGLPEGLAPGVGPAEVQVMVARAVAFANTDVKDFALADPARFLNNTWKLLPESNASLRVVAYTIRQYRQALAKMLGFFRFLKPGNVYHSYRGQPDAQAMERMAASAEVNLGIAREYLQAKLLAIGLLEAIAIETGGDAPVALFMGDLPGSSADSEKLEDYLPPLPEADWEHARNPVYRLLREGRLDEPEFDLKHSPLALFIYECLDRPVWVALAESLEGFFAGQIAAGDWLESWPAPCRDAVMRACIRMVPTRRDRIKDWLARHGSPILEE